MDWLSNDVCEGFANCGISVDQTVDSCAQTFSLEMGKPKNVSDQNYDYGNIGYGDTNFSGEGINLNAGMNRMQTSDTSLGTDSLVDSPDFDQPNEKQELGASVKKCEAADSSMAEFTVVSEIISICYAYQLIIFILFCILPPLYDRTFTKNCVLHL